MMEVAARTSLARYSWLTLPFVARPPSAWVKDFEGVPAVAGIRERLPRPSEKTRLSAVDLPIVRLVRF